MDAGLAFVPVAVGNFASSLASSSMVARYGRTTLTIGATLQAAALVVFLVAANPDRPVPWILAGAALFGLGQGLMIPPLLGLVLVHVPVEDSGAASGVLMTVQQLAGTIGLALVSIFFFAAVGGGSTRGYVAGFRVALLCDIALAVGSVLISRLFAPPERPAELVSVPEP
jgi:MFS family permease